jgi:hypothetical protein
MNANEMQIVGYLTDRPVQTICRHFDNKNYLCVEQRKKCECASGRRSFSKTQKYFKNLTILLQGNYFSKKIPYNFNTLV